MPGFGDNPDDDDDLTDDAPDDGMFTADMIEAVARYEASLGGERAGHRRAADRVWVRGRGRLRLRVGHHHHHRGALSAMVHLLAGIAWDPQIRGFLAVGVGVVVLLGSVYLIVSTNLGARLGFLAGGERHLRLVHDHGRHLVGLRLHRHARRGTPRGRSPRSSTSHRRRRGLPDAELVEAQTLDTSALPDREEFHELEGDDFTAMAAEVEPTLDGWVILPESDPSFGEAKATVDEWFAANPDEELDITAADDYVTVYSFERGGKSQLPDDPSRLHRIGEHAEDDLPGAPPPAPLRRHPDPAGGGAGDGARRGPADAGPRRRARRWCR